MKHKLLNKLWLRGGMLVAILCVLFAGQAWATEGDVLAKLNNTAGNGYATRMTKTDNYSVSWVLSGSSSGCWGSNSNQKANVKPSAADLPVVKGVTSSATTSTQYHYFYYTTTPVSNVGSIEFFFSNQYDTSTSCNVYVVMGDAVSAANGDAYTQVELASTSTTKQGASISANGTYIFTFAATQTSAKYYGLVIKVASSSYKRFSSASLTLKEGSTGPTTHTVTYDGNEATSGTAPTDASSPYTSGATVTVLGNTGSLAKTGYTLGGWNTKADGSGTTYSADETFTITENTTLYAKWNVNQYNVTLASVDDVTLSASYGTSSSLAEGDNADIDYGTELTLSATGLSSGYMYTWKVTDDKDNDVTNDVLDGSTLTVPTYDITISGTVIEIPLYIVTFNAGTGSCATASLKEAEQEAGVILPTATIGVTGWSFAGWATTSTTNTEVAPTLYAAGSTYKPSDNITLYAVYKFTEGTEGEYIRVTSLADVKAASKVILVNGGKTLTTDLSAKDALSESESKVTAADKTVFTLSGNDADGFTLSSSSGKIGASSLPSSNGNYTDIAITNSNSTWSITTNSTTNTYTFLNKGGSNVGLEYYSSGSKWVAYKTSNPTGSSYYSTKVYVPNFAITYNSNPAAIVNPTIAFTTASDKSLYVQDEASYTNAANVTGISKTPTYTSSNETVATVTSAGMVTALKAGSATITATVAAEVGVNTEASTTYDITVKDAKTVAGLKAITDASSVVTFTADLTDAVVTYVNGSYAYIQDASGAVYASCGGSLTAGKKINGAVSGSIKASYQIDEITAINLEDATVTDDGVIPSALSKTVAQLIDSGTSLEGQLVQVSGATVTTSLASGNASGGKISDDSKVSEINLYAPASNIEALKDAEGTFTGYISYYNASTYRLNIYDQSQITITKNAPTDQTLTFASDAVELDEDTDDYDDFTGQTVSGAQGAVIYSIDSDDDDVVTSINASTGVVVLSGNYGTATIKASAAAKEVTVAGVTTPYKATAKTYTITVYPRYTVTFNVNGTEIAVREASHGAGVAVPETPTLPGYTFRGWNTSAVVAATDTKPAGLTDLAATIYPEDNDDEYHAVYAVAEEGELEEHTSTFTIKLSSAPSSPYVNNGSSWTWSNVTFKNDASACINSSNGSVTFTLPSGGKAKSLNITKTSNAWAGAAEVVLKDASSNEVKTYTGSSLSFNFTKDTYDQSSSYTLSNTSSKNAWIEKIDFVYEKAGVTYSGYTTIVTSVAVGSACYTTYVTNHDVSFPDGMTGYIATEVGDNRLMLTSKASVPSGTPIIIKADAGTYTLNKIDTTPESVTGNLLQASDGTVTGGEGIYALAKKNEVVGFYPVDSNVTIPAGKAYINTGAGVKAFTFVFDDDADGIQTLSDSPLKGESIYNLAGQRIQKMQKGINIVNGKKILK